MTHLAETFTHDGDPPKAVNGATSTWTDELAEQVKSLWETHSASQISGILNGQGHHFSRNAIISKICRLNLSASDKTATHRSTNRSNGGRTHRPSPSGRAQVAERVVLPFVGYKYLTIQEVTNGQCKFECSGSDVTSEFRFCGNPVREGSSYCPTCCQIVYEPLRSRRAA